MSPRLALMQRGDAASEALLFETSSQGPNAYSCSSNPDALAEAADVSADVVASVLDLKITLLASAVRQQSARFIRDVCSYCQVG